MGRRVLTSTLVAGTCPRWKVMVGHVPWGDQLQPVHRRLGHVRTVRSTWRVVFDGATSFDQGIGDWDVTSVDSMKSMFHGATSFNQYIGDWTMPLVENMRDMFHGATSFNQDIGGWAVPLGGTSMAGYVPWSDQLQPGHWRLGRINMFHGADQLRAEPFWNRWPFLRGICGRCHGLARQLDAHQRRHQSPERQPSAVSGVAHRRLRTGAVMMILSGECRVTCPGFRVRNL